MKNQSDAVDANVKKVVEYVRDNPRCTKSMVNHNIGIKGERAKAARDTADYKKLIEFDGKGYRVTDNGKALPGLPPRWKVSSALRKWRRPRRKVAFTHASRNRTG